MKDFPGGSDAKESICNAGDLGSIPGLGGSPGGGNSNSLQYSCLENSMDREAWCVTVLGVVESDTVEQSTDAQKKTWPVRSGIMMCLYTPSPSQKCSYNFYYTHTIGKKMPKITLKQKCKVRKNGKQVLIPL